MKQALSLAILLTAMTPFVAFSDDQQIGEIQLDSVPLIECTSKDGNTTLDLIEYIDVLGVALGDLSLLKADSRITLRCEEHRSSWNCNEKYLPQGQFQYKAKVSRKADHTISAHVYVIGENGTEDLELGCKPGPRAPTL